MTPASRLRLLTDVGADRYASRQELRWPATLDHGWIDEVWRVYTSHFDGCTGARLDPGFERFHHPAHAWGALQLTPGSTVLVAGTGPSLAANAEALRQVRDRLLIFTSPRGAAELTGLGLVPDLIVVERRPALTAGRSGPYETRVAFPASAWVAAELRTPATTLSAVSPERLFIPHAWPGWGCWPATAVALALAAKAGRVALIGVDRDDAEGEPSEFAATTALLTLLARTGIADCVDAGRAAMEGWTRQPLPALAQETPAAPLRVDTWSIGARYFIDEAARWRGRADTLIVRARQALAMAITVRDGADPEHARVAAGIVLAWGDDPAVRTGLQDMLGLTQLPRLWRAPSLLRSCGATDAGLDRLVRRSAQRESGMPPEQLWRPVMLGLQELVAQSERLDGLLPRHAPASRVLIPGTA